MTAADPAGGGARAQALAGLRILDLSGGIAGPLGVLLLAEHGADVIRVEPPGGHPDRALPASRVYNRSKRSMTIDLEQPEGREVLLELCATADVLVEASAPGVMARRRLEYDDLRHTFPRLVYCSIPAWPSGVRYADRPGYEALVHARTGQQWENTSFRSGPVFLHSPVASFGAMFLVPIGIMSALHARERTGRGQHIEVSLLQGVLSLTTQIWNWTDRGQFLLPKTHPPGVHQATIYECADGEWIHASTQAGITPTRSEAEILGIDDVAYAALMQMAPAEKAAYEEQKQAAFKRRRRGELIEEYHAAGLGAEAIVAPHERFSHAQLRATGGVVDVEDPEVGNMTQLGVPIYLQGTPGAVQGPQPLPGANTNEILESLGRSPEDIEQLRRRGVV
jgi:crotonobetainyl-CoA:carnitine CoA-transferase CaiB-like acyl-CoA transferase